MEKITVNIAMIGAGRATELHMEAYRRLIGIEPVFKVIYSNILDGAEQAKKLYGFERCTDNFDEIINDPEIKVIDICTPPYVHEEMVIKALRNNKNVICEKPLAGYFGKEEDLRPIGNNVSKRKMYESLLESLDEIKCELQKSSAKFMYAENFIYAPAIQKMAEIIRKKKSRILCIKGEESLKGSSSSVAGEWSKTGGGTFTRTGSHPLTAALWLKQVEAKAHDEEIRVISVTADMGFITNGLTEHEHRHIAARPIDVEDFGTAILTFSDNSKAVIIATDTLLGGSKNYVEAYCNDATLYANLTLNNMMSTYFLDEENLDDVYLSEMLPSKTGWNNPFILDEVVRGYSAEIQDFMEAIVFDRKPESNFDLAYETAKITYAAYLSAEEGKRILV